MWLWDNAALHKSIDKLVILLVHDARACVLRIGLHLQNLRSKMNHPITQIDEQTEVLKGFASEIDFFSCYNGAQN